MALPLFTGLLLQGFALLLVLLQVRGRWLTHTGVLFVIMVSIFHGLTEVVQALFPGYNTFRLLVGQEDIDNWVAVVGLAISIFAVVYVWSLRHRESHGVTNEIYQSDDRLRNLAIVDWRVVLALSLPSYLVVLLGQERELLGYWIVGLTDQFFLFGLVLAAFLFTIRHPRAKMPTMVALLAALALLGSRLTVLLAMVLLLFAWGQIGITLRLRTIVLPLLLVGFVTLTVSGARIVTGRESFAGDIYDRGTALLAGTQLFDLLDSSRSVRGSDLLNDYVYRFDGNAFGAMINRRLASGQAGAGLQPLWSNVLVAIPSFVNPEKLYSDEILLSEKVYMTYYYGLPTGIDYLQTTLGILLGYYGVVGLMPLMVGLGWLFARTDIWLNSSRTLLSVIVGMGTVTSVVFYEQGVRIYFITFRAIAVLVIVLVLWQGLTRLARGAIRRPARATGRRV